MLERPPYGYCFHSQVPTAHYAMILSWLIWQVMASLMTSTIFKFCSFCFRFELLEHVLQSLPQLGRGMSSGDMLNPWLDIEGIFISFRSMFENSSNPLGTFNQTSVKISAHAFVVLSFPKKYDNSS